MAKPMTEHELLIALIMLMAGTVFGALLETVLLKVLGVI